LVVESLNTLCVRAAVLPISRSRTLANAPLSAAPTGRLSSAGITR
tara:strand:- start:941 stop:1075 length:135 start_codon:yes stop_codon:yes gene_type:complete